MILAERMEIFEQGYKSNNFCIYARKFMKDKRRQSVVIMSNSYGQAPVPVASLKVGTRVAILGTENVQQRFPHLEGCIGVIKEAPVHPATWFKVIFPPDPTVVTFRPSVKSDGNLEALKNSQSSTSAPVFVRVNPGFSYAQAQRNAAKLASEGKATGETTGATASEQEGESGEPSSPLLLSSTDPEQWVGQQVSILGGKMDGEVGRVVSSGNGWVQIETANGEVAKRAYNLSIIPQEGAVAAAVNHSRSAMNREDTASSGLSQHDSYSAKDEAGTRAALSLRSSATASNRSGGQTDRDKDKDKESIVPFAEPPRPRNLRDRRKDTAESDLHPGKTSLEIDVLHEPVKAAHVSIAPEASSSAAVHSYSSSRRNTALTASDYSSSRRNTALTASEPEQLIVHHALQKTKHGSKYQQLLESSRTGKIKVDNAIIEARRAFLSKYVARQQQKLKQRPHLSDLKHGLNASFSNHLSGNAVDLGHSSESLASELRAARLFDEDTFCEDCWTQKWPGGKFCWNEACSSSPVYWKLTGVDLAEVEQMQYQQQQYLQQLAIGEEFDDFELPDAPSSCRSRRGSNSNPCSPRASGEKRRNGSFVNSEDGKSPRRFGDPFPAMTPFPFGIPTSSSRSPKSPRSKGRGSGEGSYNGLDSSLLSDVMLLSSMDPAQGRSTRLLSASPRSQSLASDILALRAGGGVATAASSSSSSANALAVSESALAASKLLHVPGHGSQTMHDAEVSNVAAYLLQMPAMIVGHGPTHREIPHKLRDGHADYNDFLEEEDERSQNENNEADDGQYYLPTAANDMDVEVRDDDSEADPKVEPKVEVPKAKVVAPKVEAPKVEAPKVEAPKVEVPKAPVVPIEATVTFSKEKPSVAPEGLILKDIPIDTSVKETSVGPSTEDILK
eukprot:gene18854-19175_t